MSFEVKTYDLNYGFDLNHPTVRFVRDVDVPYNTLTTTAINKQVPGILTSFYFIRVYIGKF